LQPAQEDAEQPLHPEPDDDDVSPDPLPIPNFERRFVVSFELQAGQRTSGFDPKTSFSKQQLQELH
jgi:hypothetical protein